MTEEKAPAAGAPPEPGAETTAPGTPPAPTPEPTPSPPEPTVAEWESRFKYLLADFENYRKRAEREREAIRTRAEADVLRNLLPIQDAFERAREFVRSAPHSDPVRRGMELLAREWDGFLKREGIEPVAHVGGRFNADDQEVVGEAAPPPGQAPGTVLEVVQQGYRFRVGLLRPAKVLIARAPTPAAVKGASASELGSPAPDAPTSE